MKFKITNALFRFKNFLGDTDEVFKCFFNDPKRCLEDALDDCYPYVYLDCSEGASYTIPAEDLVDRC